MLKKYPSSLASRCFAFEPNDENVDDVKGLTMIPNVGNKSFYMEQCCNDLTADLVLAFGSLVP